ncbi:MAG TPA: serine protease [Elusimicrobia bacterium]|nr:MAG: hypothetical protein A2016_09955 [Elusimicrobia bacterium GWF2_62_30]HBA59335.1 serine protease [Elusimicrobiota bacterium]
MVKTTRTFFSFAALLALPALSSAAGKSIYGPDDRLDYYEAPAAIQALSDSVVSLWSRGDVSLSPSTGKYNLSTITLGESNTLCAGEKFYEQATGAFCSGALVGEDLVMTAGHCVKNEEECDELRLVFGFNVAKAGETGVTSVAKSEVYNCSKIAVRYKAGEPGSPVPAGQRMGADYALIKLDRKVSGHKPLAINRSAGAAKDAKIFVIGHPSGLPLKVAAESKVRDAGKTGYFVADLDTFGGNSGSAVFSLATHKIEGILVRGDNDYVYSDEAGCSTVAVFPQDGGRGEDVTKIAELATYVPLLPGEKTGAAQPVDVAPPAGRKAEPLPLRVSFE